MCEYARKLLAMLFLVGLGTAADALRGESFDDSVRLLVQEEQYVAAGLRDSGIKFEQRSFPVALSGRRSVRLIDDLEGLDPSAACEPGNSPYRVRALGTQRAPATFSPLPRRVLRRYTSRPNLALAAGCLQSVEGRQADRRHAAVDAAH